MAPTDAQRKQAPANQALAETNVPSAAESQSSLDSTHVPKPRPSAVQSAPAAVTRVPAPGQPAPAPGEPKKVSQIGDFKLIKKLGQGGMGTVFLATQVSLDRKVALKTLSKEFAKKPDFVARFIREARSMARLQHPNIVQVYAAESKQGVHFAAIEFIDGCSMQNWMDKLGKLSVGDALHVVLVCADALKHAHDLNMIHRDIKPDNILVTKAGVVKVADFGLAKAIDEDVSMTQSGTGLGTPLYMAPEQARNAKHVDNRTDIYALGCTLYYFLTGKLPFQGQTTLELIQAKEKGTFAPARRSNPDVPERLDLIIDKMMAKDPQHRYGTCGEVISALQGLNLASPALTFIDGAQQTLLSRSGPATRAAVSSTTLPPPPQRAGKPVTSAEDAARQAQKAAPTITWTVLHQNAAGKPITSRMTTEQIKAGVNSGKLEWTAKAKKTAAGSFLSLAQYPEFDGLVQHRAVQEKAEARSKDVKSIFNKLDKQDRRRKRWRWLRNLTDNVKGLISLVLYLAIIAAVLIGAVVWGIPFIRQYLGQ